MIEEVHDQGGYDDEDGHHRRSGRLTGTSNACLAMKHHLTPIGTMSHQLIQSEENVNGVFGCNFNVTKKFNDVYDGDNSIYLYDCLGDKVFFNSLSKHVVVMFVGLRVNSGDENEQTDKIIEKYESLDINPATKQVVYSDGLDIEKAVQIHKYVDGRMQDSYDVGTFLTCDVANAEPMNIVVKPTHSRTTEKRERYSCVELSCDKSKTTGDAERCTYLLCQIG